MKKGKIFLSCSVKDKELFQTIQRMLEKKGYTVFDVMDIPRGGNFIDYIHKEIRDCDCFVPIITEAYNSSEAVLHELSLAIKYADGRGKRIYPLCFTRKISESVQYYIGRYTIFNIEQGDKDALNKAVDKLDILCTTEITLQILYEKLSEFIKIKNNDGMAEVLCELISLCRERIIHYKDFGANRKEAWYELLRLYERLSLYSGTYHRSESRDVAKKIVHEMRETNKIIYDDIYMKELFYASVAIRIIYLDKEIRGECADILSYGDIHSLEPTKDTIKRQKIFVETYREQYEVAVVDKQWGMSQEDIDFIQETSNYILEDKFPSAMSKKEPSKEPIKELSEEDEILHAIAGFMKEGNKLFDVLESHGMAGDFSKCLLTSYERLKSYCEIVGANKVAADCVERIVEIRRELVSTKDESNKNEKIENGIKSLLGFTVSGTGNYDVFISFKSEDMDLAGNVYHFMKSNLKEAFWSEISLPELSASDYGEAIDNALDKSKHFVLVISNLEYLKADWVSYEMKTFNAEMREGRKKGSNFIIVATDDVYDKIIQSNKELLPMPYRRHNIIKMSEYKNTLISYIS